MCTPFRAGQRARRIALQNYDTCVVIATTVLSLRVAAVLVAAAQGAWACGLQVPEPAAANARIGLNEEDIE